MLSPEPTQTSAFTSPSHLIATVNPVCYVLIVINLCNRSWGAVHSVGTTKNQNYEEDFIMEQVFFGPTSWVVMFAGQL